MIDRRQMIARRRRRLERTRRTLTVLAVVLGAAAMLLVEREPLIALCLVPPIVGLTAAILAIHAKEEAL